jgi:hypothetical protein
MHKFPLYIVMGFALYGFIEAVLSGNGEQIAITGAILLFLVAGVFMIEKKFSKQKNS